MARQLRIEIEGGFYHITSRGNLKERIFFADDDRKKFLEILERTKNRYGYILHAYALMDNHFHLLIETPKANISQIMQNINTSYTVYINNKYQRSGHLFQGRYKSIIVDKDSYLLELSRYIHLNPVRSGLVKHPQDYIWTSYLDYVESGRKDRTLVDIEDTLSYFHRIKVEAKKLYQQFVEEGIEKNFSPFKNLEGRTILGGKEFEEKIRKIFKGEMFNDEIPALKIIKKEMSLKEAMERIEKIYREENIDIRKRGRSKQERKISIYLTKIISGAKNIEVGKSFGIKSAAVSNIIKNIEAQMKISKDLENEVNKLREKILNEK